jgi:hypothetical protein
LSQGHYAFQPQTQGGWKCCPLGSFLTFPDAWLVHDGCPPRRTRIWQFKSCSRVTWIFSTPIHFGFFHSIQKIVRDLFRTGWISKCIASRQYIMVKKFVWSSCRSYLLVWVIVTMDEIHFGIRRGWSNSCRARWQPLYYQCIMDPIHTQLIGFMASLVSWLAVPISRLHTPIPNTLQLTFFGEEALFHCGVDGNKCLRAGLDSDMNDGTCMAVVDCNVDDELQHLYCNGETIYAANDTSLCMAYHRVFNKCPCRSHY